MSKRPTLAQLEALTRSPDFKATVRVNMGEPIAMVDKSTAPPVNGTMGMMPGNKPQGKSKYNNKRVEWNGLKFDSKAELHHWQELYTMERQGFIKNLERQVRYSIVVNGVKICTYVADMRYIKDGVTVVVDVKGMKTPIYNLKKKLMQAALGITIVEVKK